MAFPNRFLQTRNERFSSNKCIDSKDQAWQVQRRTLKAWQMEQLTSARKAICELLTPVTCIDVVGRAFEKFDLVKSTILPLPILTGGILLRSYKIFFETRAAPWILPTPDECIGGLQFAHRQRRFVYRFDNCVLSFLIACNATASKLPWKITGAIYLVPTIDDARELLKKLLQTLPLVLEGDGILAANRIPSYWEKDRIPSGR